MKVKVVHTVPTCSAVMDFIDFAAELWLHHFVAEEAEFDFYASEMEFQSFLLF